MKFPFLRKPWFSPLVGAVMVIFLLKGLYGGLSLLSLATGALIGLWATLWWVNAKSTRKREVFPDYNPGFSHHRRPF